MQHSHWQEPWASQEVLPVTAGQRATEPLKMAIQESRYMANNVYPQSLKLLRQMMLEVWLWKPRAPWSKALRHPRTSPKHHHSWTFEKCSSVATLRYPELHLKTKTRVILRKHIHIAKLKGEQNRRKQVWQTKTTTCWKLRWIKASPTMTCEQTIFLLCRFHPGYRQFCRVYVTVQVSGHDLITDSLFLTDRVNRSFNWSFLYGFNQQPPYDICANIGWTSYLMTKAAVTWFFMLDQWMTRSSSGTIWLKPPPHPCLLKWKTKLNSLLWVSTSNLATKN